MSRALFLLRIEGRKPKPKPVTPPPTETKPVAKAKAPIAAAPMADFSDDDAGQ